MLISKFYNRAASKSPSNMAPCDPRIITPSSIPIFILPPTMDAYATNTRIELNDSYDCWSITEDNDQTSNTNQTLSNNHTNNKACLNNQTSNTNSNNNSEKKLLNLFTKTSNLAKNSSTSMENLKTNYLTASAPHTSRYVKSNKSTTTTTTNQKSIEDNSTNASRRNSPPLSISSTGNNNNDSNNFNKSKSPSSNASTKTIIKTLFRNGLLNLPTVNNDTDEIKSKASYCSQWVLKHGGNNCDKVKSEKQHQSLNLDDDLTNTSAKLSKSPSYKHIDDDYLAKAKAEENLQREYLMNLLKQLENEQNLQLINHQELNNNSIYVGGSCDVQHTKNKPINIKAEPSTRNSMDNTKQAFKKLKKTKRSKSETFLTQWLVSNGTNPTNSISTKGTSSKRSSSASSRNFNTVIQRTSSPNIDPANNNNNNKNNIQSKSNKVANFLEVSKSNDEEAKNRRFSFRNFFRSKNNELNKNNKNQSLISQFSSETQPTNNIELFNTSTLTNKVHKNKKHNTLCSNYSLSNSSSVNTTNSTPSVLTPAASTLNFNSMNKTGKTLLLSTPAPCNIDDLINRSTTHTITTNSNTAKKSTSDPTVNKIHLNPTPQKRLNSLFNNEALLKIPSGGEGLVGSEAQKRQSLRESTGSVSNNNNQAEDDFDKAFNEFKQRESNTIESNCRSSNVNYQVSNGKRSHHNNLTKTLTKSYRNMISALFKHKPHLKSAESQQKNDEESNIEDYFSKAEKHRRSRTLDSTTKRKLKYFLRRRRKNSLDTDPGKQWPPLDEYDDDEDASSYDENNNNNSEQENNDFDESDVNNNEPSNNDSKIDHLNFYSIERELNRRGSLVKSNDIFYIKINQKPSKITKAKSSNLKPSCSTGSKTNNQNNNLFKTSSIQNLDSIELKTNEAKPAATNSSTNPAKKSNNWLKLSKEKAELTGYIDVSIEKLQQHFSTHVLAVSFRNFHVEPLIEINHIKSKLTYLTVELVDTNKMSGGGGGSNNVENVVESGSFTSSVEKNSLHSSHYKQNRPRMKRPKLYAKISKNKTVKCKFDANGKNFVKPVEFELCEEHFMHVANEAASLQMQKVCHKSVVSPDLFGADLNCGLNKEAKKYLFLFSIEIHSYLPISRKTLSSTFRKKKRIFKGQCQIYENFIRNTQFTKKFQLCEV